MRLHGLHRLMSASAELLSLLAMPLHCFPDKQSYNGCRSVRFGAPRAVAGVLMVCLFGPVASQHVASKKPTGHHPVPSYFSHRDLLCFGFLFLTPNHS